MLFMMVKVNHDIKKWAVCRSLTKQAWGGPPPPVIGQGPAHEMNRARAMREEDNTQAHAHTHICRHMHRVLIHVHTYTHIVTHTYMHTHICTQPNRGEGKKLLGGKQNPGKQ